MVCVGAGVDGFGVGVAEGALVICGEAGHLPGNGFIAEAVEATEGCAHAPSVGCVVVEGFPEGFEGGATIHKKLREEYTIWLRGHLFCEVFVRHIEPIEFVCWFDVVGVDRGIEVTIEVVIGIEGVDEVGDCCYGEGGRKGTRIVEGLGNEEQRICWSGCCGHTRHRDVEQIEVAQEGQGAVAALRPAIDEEFTWGDVFFFQYLKGSAVHIETGLRGALRNEVGVGQLGIFGGTKIIWGDNDIALRSKLRNHELCFHGAGWVGGRPGAIEDGAVLVAYHRGVGLYIFGDGDETVGSNDRIIFFRDDGRVGNFIEFDPLLRFGQAITEVGCLHGSVGHEEFRPLVDGPVYFICSKRIDEGIFHQRSRCCWRDRWFVLLGGTAEEYNCYCKCKCDFFEEG